jgi:putative oxidoreductase
MVPVLLGIAMTIELAGSVCIVIGCHARVASFVMFLYTVVLTLLFHNFWAATGQLEGIEETHFRKNLAIMGGLLMLAYCGSGSWSVRRGDRNAPTQ